MISRMPIISSPISFFRESWYVCTQVSLEHTELIVSYQRSQNEVDSALVNAEHLERMLAVILKGVMDGYAEAAVVHDQSIQLMSQRTASEADIMVTAMAAAIAVTTTLRDELVSPG